MAIEKSEKQHIIIDETRRSIIDALLAIGSLTGDMQYHQFAKNVCPSLDESIISEIARHMDRFHDWEESFLLDTIIDYLNLSDEQFIFFIEQYVNPNNHHYRWNDIEEQKEQIPNFELVEIINRYLEHDDYKLVVKDSIGDKIFYQCLSTKPGVKGDVKNIIFAARYKPEIVFDDALNNDIRITKNANHCLIYNRTISSKGLMWNDLVQWYAETYGVSNNYEKEFINRLSSCLDVSFKENGATSGPETWMLQAYYDLKKELGIDLPALIPQVYLYYDPLTIKERGYKLFEHQKMDFLMIISHRERIVIEIDGKQHYSRDNIASPELYSEMVKAHREMSLLGYDVYRFGGYEFYNADKSEETEKTMLENIKLFYVRLFKKYEIIS